MLLPKLFKVLPRIAQPRFDLFRRNIQNFADLHNSKLLKVIQAKNHSFFRFQLLQKLLYTQSFHLFILIAFGFSISVYITAFFFFIQLIDLFIAILYGRILKLAMPCNAK